MIGQTLEHYRIDSKLGEGGMGVVYKAHDPRLNRAVAIKVLPPGRVADPVAKQRFVQEARAASALNHPSVVTIHDIRSDAGIDFIVMEYVEGKTLGELIPAKGMRAAQALRYAIQIADAFATAHRAGIVHRDLKPSNLMVTPEDRIKILDFGLAKLLDAAASPTNETTIVAPLTEERVVLGTVAYMSPEQAEGRLLDSRSDIFSFGVVLYEMTTGQRPFAADSRLSLLTKIVNHDPTPPSEMASSIPPNLERAILRCLRKDPGRRFQTMADLKVALEDIELETAAETGARPAATAPSRWRWAWAAVLPIVLAAGYAGWQTRITRAPTEPLRANALTTSPGQELYPALSPDGNHVAFTWTGPRQDNTDIYVQQIGAGSPLRLTTDPRSEYDPVWSPDGRWIAFLRGDAERPLASSDREVRLIAPLGGPERKLTDVRVQEITVHPAYLAWCPDSTCLITTDTLGEGKPDALFVVSLETGDKRPLTHPEAPVLADTNPSLSPDGASLLFLRRTTWAGGELHVLPLGGDMTAAGQPRHIAATDLKPDHATWLPDGTEVLFSTGAISGTASLWRLSVSGEGKPARLPFVGEDGVMPVVSRSQPGRAARLVYVRSFTDENIWRIDVNAVGTPASAPAAVAIASTKADIHPQVSPDGRRVAFTSTRSGAWEIWVSDSDGSNPVRLTSLQAPTGTGVPHWSPDGRLIVFASDAEGQFDIFVVPSAGGKPRNITSHPAMEHVPSFSREGKWIYFSSTRSGQFQVWRVPVSGGDAVQVTKEGGWVSQESVDGAYLYFTPTAAIGALTQVWRVPTSGGEAVKLLDGVLNGAFAVIEQGIYYIGKPSIEAQVQFFDFANRRSVTVASGLGEVADVGGFAVSADGRIVLYPRRDAAVDDLMLVENFR